MTTYIEGKHGIFLGAQAWLIEDDREIADQWFSQHMVDNPFYKWMVGRFVEADRANSNKQLFSLQGLQMYRPTIAHAPMNMNHSARRVVGSYVATDLIYPTGNQTAALEDLELVELADEEISIDSDTEYLESLDARDFNQDKRKKLAKKGHAMPDGSFPIENEGDLKNAIKLAGNAKNPGAARAHIKKRASALGLSNLIPESWGGQKAAATDAGLNPYIEALGVFWNHYFPEEYQLVQAAHAEGRLYYSMECVPEEIQCAGADGCGKTFEYAGRTSPTYCPHLNEFISDKLLINPHFTAGAVLTPPVRPGWSRADVHSLVAKHCELAESIYTGLKTELSHLDPRDWELLMGELLSLATAE